MYLRYSKDGQLHTNVSFPPRGRLPLEKFFNKKNRNMVGTSQHQLKESSEGVI